MCSISYSAIIDQPVADRVRTSLGAITQKRHTCPAQLAQKTAAQMPVHGSNNRICKLTLAIASRVARKPRKPRIPQNAERKHNMAHKFSSSADVEPIFPSVRTSPANKCCVCKAEAISKSVRNRCGSCSLRTLQLRRIRSAPKHPSCSQMPHMAHNNDSRANTHNMGTTT